MNQLPSASSSASVPGNLPAELEDRRHLLVGDAAYLANLAATDPRRLLFDVDE